ncbi:hypothetical protein LGV61_09885 [Desulfurispirillum indicum]|uniref:hypothetical protein n=1 Tax=Desulfurispirillum indicum TaxID=936456 RepID=UPI001CF9B271|nr:hypothetical protein [Desulfurispirillum indicum]UCZ56030.1 hypothetical protein LGV61_09885 [Desulfurispirillum indicum]
MLSVNDLKGLLEVNRIAVIPFIVTAYLSEWGFAQFPSWVSSHWLLLTGAFVIVVVGAFVASWFVFDLALYLDYQINLLTGKQIDIIYSLATVSLITFGILGFFRPEPFDSVGLAWHVAAGASGLYLLDVQRKVRDEMSKKT